MPKLSTLKVDVDKIARGVWVDHPSGARFLIARLNNPEHTRWLAAKKAPRMREWRAGTVSDEDQKRLIREGIGRCVLLGWENLQDEDGETPIAYTVEASAALCLDPAMCDFVDWVVNAAADASAYRLETARESAGN